MVTFHSKVLVVTRKGIATVEDCLTVFTSRNIDQMIAQGGSRAWKLDASRARTCRYLVCTWNATGEFVRASEGRRNGEAFLVAPISSIDTDRQEPGRYIVRFTEFARVSMQNIWPGVRNPVRYCSIQDVGFDPDRLTFEPVPPYEPAAPPGERSAIATLTIDDAKLGLAATFGVSPESIEIVIRG
jgi:hypothetical protein